MPYGCFRILGWTEGLRRARLPCPFRLHRTPSAPRRGGERGGPRVAAAAHWCGDRCEMVCWLWAWLWGVGQAVVCSSHLCGTSPLSRASRRSRRPAESKTRRVYYYTKNALMYGFKRLASGRACESFTAPCYGAELRASVLGITTHYTAAQHHARISERGTRAGTGPGGIHERANDPHPLGANPCHGALEPKSYCMRPCSRRKLTLHGTHP